MIRFKKEDLSKRQVLFFFSFGIQTALMNQGLEDT